MPELYRIRFPGSWTYNAHPADDGLVFALEGCPNDAMLIRIGYIELLPGQKRKLADCARCGTCGEYFDSDRARTAHGQKRHAPASDMVFIDRSQDGWRGGYSSTGGVDIERGTLVPDVDGDDEERYALQRAPLFLEQTTASRRG